MHLLETSVRKHVQSVDMPTEEGRGDADVTFGHYFSTGTATMGAMELSCDSEEGD